MTRLSTEGKGGWVWRIRFAAESVVIATAVAGSIWALKNGTADIAFRHGPAWSILAARLAPGNAAYQAQQYSLTGKREFLERAVALNPYYSWAWIQLGLAAESEGDLVSAESNLERAAEVDRAFAPRWALCDFSFRHDRRERFWYWAHQALGISDADPRAVFRLAWQAAPNVDAILEQAKLPPGPAGKKFLAFLVEEHPDAARGPNLEKLLPAAEIDQTPLLVSHVEKLIAGGSAGDAIAVWNRLCQRGYLRFQPLDPARGISLTNADFALPFSEKGFDWRLEEHAGIFREMGGPAGELTLQFSGAEPEQCVILSQRVPVAPGRRQEFRFESRMESAHPQDGVRWKLRTGTASGALLAESAELTGPSWTPGRISFESPASSIVSLALEYQRPAGATRLRGQLSFRKLETRLP